VSTVPQKRVLEEERGKERGLVHRTRTVTTIWGPPPKWAHEQRDLEFRGFLDDGTKMRADALGEKEVPHGEVCQDADEDFGGANMMGVSVGLRATSTETSRRE